MIKKIKILPRSMMEEFVKVGECDMKDSNWNLVSIYGDGDGELLTEANKKSLQNLGCKDSISLNFFDIINREQYPGGILFRKSQAEQIVAFIDKLQEQEEDSILIAHCTAGISRSGAVGTFTCDYCGLDYQYFLAENPFIFANPLVLKLLQAVANKPNSFEWHDGVAPVDPKWGFVISPPWKKNDDK